MFEVRVRDGTARIGTLKIGGAMLTTPAVIKRDDLFPDLKCRPHSNIPLGADRDFVEIYLVAGEEQPIAVHPAVLPAVKSGDCVIVPGWHTAAAMPRRYTEWIIALKESAPPDCAWYAPASALPSSVCMLVYSGFDLFDYTAVDLKTAQGIFCTPAGEFPAVEARDEGLCSCDGCRAGDLSVHNRRALEGELGLVRRFIRASQLRELVEARCRMNAAWVSVLRFLDRHYDFLERSAPVARACQMRANASESITRPEVRRFAERVAERFIPRRSDVAVLLPCSARKPYSLSQSHHRFAFAIRGRAHELVITSPLGLVPRELEGVYPAAHYDVPVTGYWDREEIAILAKRIVPYFEKHRYPRVIAHLDGGALSVARSVADQCGIEMECTCTGSPTSSVSLAALSEALDGERTRRTSGIAGILSWQFGVSVEDHGLVVKGRREIVKVFSGREQCFSLDSETGLLRPTFAGWDLLDAPYRVAIDDFIPHGDVLAPGVIGAGDQIRPGDEVLVEGPSALATGRAMMGADEMRRSSRGVAVRVRKVKKLE